MRADEGRITRHLTLLAIAGACLLGAAGCGGDDGSDQVVVAAAVPEAPEPESDDEITEFHPIIIAESTTALKQLSVSEAVMELDMTGAPVVVFRHAGHGRNVRRRRGLAVGQLEPETLGHGSRQPQDGVLAGEPAADPVGDRAPSAAGRIRRRTCHWRRMSPSPIPIGAGNGARP